MSKISQPRERTWRRWVGALVGSAVVAAGLVSMAPPEPAAAAAPGPKDATAVLFSYPWNQIAEECENTLGPAGYGYVQTSPPQEHVRGSQWWTYYQPVSYKLESRLGTEAEFQSMIDRCNAAGVEVIVDAVINHMSGSSTGGTGWAGTDFQHYNYPGLYSSNDFHSCRRDIANYNDRWEVQNCNLVNLADLDTGSPYVQGQLAGYLNKLVNMGAAGFRIDAVKHIAASDMNGIWSKVNDKDAIYVVQEAIRAAGEPIQPEEYTDGGDVHEFAYARKLKEAFTGSRIDWLISGAGIGATWDGFLSQDNAAVFVDNHDTERNGETLSYKNGATYDLAQTFTLAWPYGSPSIHSGYQFSDYNAGPAQDGSGRVIDPAPGQNGWTFKHAQNDIQNMVGFRVETYGTDVVNKWSSADGAAVAFGRGSKGYVVVNNGSNAVQRTFTTSLPDGEYYNVITAQRSGSNWSGAKVTVSGGSFSATVPAKTALALHTGAKVASCTDIAAPSTPTGVQATLTGTTASVSWTASTDDCAVASYSVVRTGGTGGAVTKTTTGQELTDSGLSASTEYTYTVTAKDASGKTSGGSTPATVTTADAPATVTTSIYYQAPTGWNGANLHYRVGAGAWTTAPGVAMTAVPGAAGWFTAQVTGGADQNVTAAFNNGSGAWDNNGSNDYTIPAGGDRSVSGGAVTEGKPAIEEPTGVSTVVYYQAPSSWANVYAHYRVGTGSWTAAPGTKMTAVAGADGWYSLAIEGAADSTITAAFNNGAGTWDNNATKNYTIATGGDRSVAGGVVTTGKPATAEPLAGKLTLFYKPASWTTVYAHNRVGAGAWTTAPGAKMTALASCDGGAGWFRVEIPTGSASQVTVAFNNGAGSWDNNASKDYTFTTATAAVSGGAISTADPCGEGAEPTLPVTPTSLSVGEVTTTTAVLSWAAVAGADTYRIALDAASGGASRTLAATQTSVTVSGLTAGTPYWFKVRAENPAGVSAYSESVVATTTPTPSPTSTPTTKPDPTPTPTPTPTEPSDGERRGSLAGATTGEPLGGDPREDAIYFMMTARWNDGDASNNRGGNQHVKSGNAANEDPMFRGDFKGVVDKLDYIKGLGFSAIWITPVVTNRSDYDFHGYHGWDFVRIDPRLESDDVTYQELINAAHAKGIKIYQDVVYNHTSRWGAKDLFVPTVYGVRDSQWSWYYDQPVAGKAYNPLEEDADGSTYNGDLWASTQPADQNCKNWGVPSGSSAEGYKVYNCQWPNATSGMFPSDSFHQCWIGNWEGKDAQDCWIHEDLADLNTESAKVQDFLIDTYNKYIDMGVDGFRIDTAVHIPRVMWNRHFLPAIQEHAVEVHGEKGKDFYVFGEVAQFVHDKWNRGSVNHSAPFYTWDERREYSQDDVVAAAEQFNYENLMGTGGQPTSNNHLLNGNTYHAPDHSKASGMNIIDMRMHMNFSDASTAFHAGMDSDDATNDATYNAVYVDSHDYGPGKSQTRYDGGTSAWAENLSLMWTFRGVPVLYYGSEIEFQAGEKIDCGPTCPLAMTGRAYFGDHLEGTVVASDFGKVSSATGAVAETLNSPLAKHLQALNQIRRAVPALQKGQYSREGVSGNIAYKKRFTEGGVDSFVLVSVSGSATFSGIPNGTYTDAVTGDVKVVTNGTLTANASGQGNMRAYVLSLPGNPAPGKVGNGSPFLK